MRMSLACTCLSMSSVTLPEPEGTHYLALIPPGCLLCPMGQDLRRQACQLGCALGWWPSRHRGAGKGQCTRPPVSFFLS